MAKSKKIITNDLFDKLNIALTKMKNESNINNETNYIYINFDSLKNLDEGLMISNDSRCQSATFMGFKLRNSCTLKVNEFEIKEYI